MRCRFCNRNKFERVTRRSLLDKFVAPLFGYFPWRCTHCHKTTLSKGRKHLRVVVEPTSV
jgi:hypothetical protein